MRQSRPQLFTDLDFILCLALAARLHPKRDNLRTALKKIRRQFRQHERSFQLIDRTSKPHLLISYLLKDLDL